MNSNVINARITFRNSPIHVLERFTFKDLDYAYSQFKEHSGLSECVILQTCNRVELFGIGKNYDLDKITKTWASLAGLEENAFKENLETSEDIEVFNHLLKPGNTSSNFNGLPPIVSQNAIERSRVLLVTLNL